MKTIKIKKLEIRNFNGIAKADVDFTNGTTEIISPSGKGKSSLIQAVQYACGLDISGMYPHIDKYVIKDLESSVRLTIDVDGNNYILERKNQQKWGVDKLTGEKSFKGNTSSCVFDGVEINTLTLYKEKISDLFEVDVKKLPLVLDVAYFNKLHWEDQRKILTELCRLDEVVCNLNDKEEFNLLSSDLKKGKSEMDIQKVLNVLKRDINNELERNQILIADKTNQLSEMMKESFENIENKKEEIRLKIEKLQRQTQEESQNIVAESKQRAYEDARNAYYEEKRKVDAKVLERDGNVLKEKTSLSNLETNLAYEERKLANIKSTQEDLQMELDVIKEEVFDESKKECPTCHQLLPDEQVSKMISDFKERQANRETDIKVRLSNLSLDAQNAEKRINTQKTQIEEIKANLKSLESIEIDYSQVDKLKKTAEDMFKEIGSATESEVLLKIKTEISNLQEEYDECVKTLARKEMAEDLKQEIENIKARTRELAVQDQQRVLKQNQLYEYIKQKIDLVNNTVNQNFRDVKFIFFTPLTANAEKPYEMTCTVSYNGVEFEKLSTGQKIFANARVFEGLKKLLNIDIFTFIDERQSTTLDLGLSGQIVELYTSKLNTNFNPVQIKDLYSEKDTIRS